MGRFFYFFLVSVQSAACLTKGAQAMNQQLKTVAICLAVIAVIYRIDGARRLLTNSF